MHSCFRQVGIAAISALVFWIATLLGNNAAAAEIWQDANITKLNINANLNVFRCGSIQEAFPPDPKNKTSGVVLSSYRRPVANASNYNNWYEVLGVPQVAELPHMLLNFVSRHPDRQTYIQRRAFIRKDCMATASRLNPQQVVDVSLLCVGSYRGPTRRDWPSFSRNIQSRGSANVPNGDVNYEFEFPITPEQSVANIELRSKPWPMIDDEFRASKFQRTRSLSETYSGQPRLFPAAISGINCDGSRLVPECNCGQSQEHCEDSENGLSVVLPLKQPMPKGKAKSVKANDKGAAVAAINCALMLLCGVAMVASSICLNIKKD